MRFNEPKVHLGFDKKKSKSNECFDRSTVFYLYLDIKFYNDDDDYKNPLLYFKHFYEKKKTIKKNIYSTN